MLDITAFAALIKRKRGEARLTQETLAQDVFGDSARKADISRLENAKVANPQEATVQKICTALNISAAEMEPIRQSRLSAAQLDQIPTLSREELENLATRFQIDDVFDRTDADLRQLLTQKATEYRALKAEVDAIPDTMKRLSNLKADAQDAIARLDLDEVENLMTLVHATELEEAAKSAEIRANNALLRGRVDQAFTLLSSAADSFAAVDPLAPARIRILGYCETLFKHGLRYGGDGIPKASQIVSDILTAELKEMDTWLWAAGQNALAITLGNQGTRSDGLEGADLLAKAVTAYRSALDVCTRQDHPVQWATTQNNLGNALREQGTRTDGLKGADLLAQAVTSYRAALEVRTRQDHPEQWATTQNNLGNALQAQGIRTDGPKGADLLAEAVTAYRAALEVRTRQDHPVQWAGAQNNLGNALKQQGTRTAGPKGADLLAQAVTAYRAALEVRTRQDHPVDWAETQYNIAITQRDLSHNGSCTDPRAALEAALMAVDDALTVFDPDHISYYHAKASRPRDNILADIAALPPE
ncbi:tetratricopeptide repeat protein [Sulfitobacter porphyrae]|uniref:Tetratricopeptide repeat protein n=1 Tax=Sulfitobacter porphyrae TaxID=1246864 RepID=A0ABW2B1Q5_9RHOB|nr:hypothetical protein GCM10007928_28530 [Sulfitobacter porphyrae]